jgi:hypothetical protein
VIRTTCGVVKVLPDGRALRWHERHWPGTARSDEHVWVRHTGGRLTLVRNGHVWWRSSWSRGSDAVFVRGRTIVYVAYPSGYEPSEQVWLARVGGGERMIARREDPLGWTRSGVLLLQRGNALILRNARGRYVRTLHGVRHSFFDRDAQLLYALMRDGRLVRSDGRFAQTIAHVRDRRYVLSDVLDSGLIVFQRPGSMLFLDAAGRRYASATLDKRANVGGTIAKLPHGTLAFPVIDVRKKHAVDSVLLLRPGARHATAVYTQKLPLSCGHWTTLTYRAGRLLYASQGRIALIDPHRRHSTVALTRFVRALNGEGRDDGASADWA